MTYVALFLAGWAAGATLAALFIAGATRFPTPEPFMRLPHLRDLARHT